MYGQLERAMLYANIQCLRIAIYGMKIPVCDIIANDAAKCVRYDIGHNVNTPDIQIFCSDKGTTYSMFGEVFGSIK